MSGAGADTPVPIAHVLGLSVAAALVPLNSTMIAVALPAISDDFGVSTAEVSVLVTVYLVIMLVGQPIAGRVADAVGSRRAVQGALLGLAAFSALAAVATSFPMLLVARGLQAVCATALGPGIQSLLRVTAPPAEQGRVFGIFGSTMGAGAASGPVIGGVLIQLFDWRGIFVINVPIALIAVVAIASVRAPARVAGPTRAVVTPSTGRVLNPVFVSGFASQALTTQAQYALLLLTPIVLDARGWGAGSIGLVLAALTIGMIVTGPSGGRYGDAVGRRLPSAIGITVAAVATLGLAINGRSVDVVVLTVGLAVFGLGLGAATPNFMSAALGSVPDDRTGAAAGIFTTSRYVGSITTTVLIAAFVSDDASGTRTVLAVSVACMVAALAVVRWLPGPPGATTDEQVVHAATRPPRSA
jgi:MFS family permease